jgi:hypothetical protein
MRQFFFVDGFLLWLKLNVRENSFNWTGCKYWWKWIYKTFWYQ